MTERGDYRAIRRALLNGPDFHKLSKDARWTFVVLKVNASSVGLETWYHDEIVAKIASQSGIARRSVLSSLSELDGTWIAREANVFWIKGHLTHEPSLNPNDPKHRKHVQSHIGGLPRLEIVRQFVAFHRTPWFPSKECRAALSWAFNHSEETPDSPSEDPSGSPVSTLHYTTLDQSSPLPACFASVPESAHPALHAVINGARNPTGAAASIKEIADGVPNIKPTREQMGRAIVDFHANAEEWNAARLRTYVGRAIREDAPRPAFGKQPRKGPATYTYAEPEDVQ